jgi:anhydro-N-acetylmuramic acid kinase
MSIQVIGVMSGSSFDGLDIALCTFDEEGDQLTWTLSHGKTIPFSAAIEHRLATATAMTGLDLMKLDADFGKYIGEQVKKWAVNHQVNADFIASHGHTIFHHPELSFTTQIGSGAHIAFITGIDTITDFRTADVAAGGQGAPFAPAADTKLFPGYSAYLNLGGIANINIISADGHHKAWDIGPSNQALNHLAKKMGKPYDQYGDIAASGTAIKEIVTDLISMFPYESGNPKGLSNDAIQNSWLHYLDASNKNINDLMASVVESIGTLILTHCSPLMPKQGIVLVTGGGAHNTFLIETIRKKASNIPIHFQLPSKEIIDYKECALMGYLGFLTATGRPYDIKVITGASKETIGGALYKANR